MEESEFTYEYLPQRGINENTFRFYDVKTKIDGTGKPISVGFRYPSGAYKVRDLSRKDFYWKPSGQLVKPGLFGVDKFSAGSHKYVTITEGEFDALALHQALEGGPVVSVQSAATAARDAAADRSWLNSYERIYLALDNDEPGREAARSIAKLFDYNKVFLVKFTKRKDANEYVEAGESEELKKIWWHARKYLPDTIVSSFHDFDEILNTPVKTGIPYPFPSLNHLTYGIRTGESVLITAQEGVGKTEIMHAIEYHILKETDENVGAIYLEEPKRRHLQALAGLELRKPVHLPDTDCTPDEISSALKRAVRFDDRLNLYSHFGSNDPEDLLDTIRFLVSARGCRIIFLDHLSMAVSGLAGEDERRALDYLSTRLEMMVKELDFALIFVSHVNDFGQTRGSRYIGKITDIRVDATRDIVNPDEYQRRLTTLVVSKNRFCGKTGPAGTLLFDPETYTLTEIPDVIPQGTANDNGYAEKASA